ncbi:MAG TPA: carbohydrate ABC transporter permease [Chloroflexota bacterium]|nr:carbohydrate ABC transporter permease [Chloroflexota bacterium]
MQISTAPGAAARPIGQTKPRGAGKSHLLPWLGRTVVVVGLGGWAATSLFPMYWMVITALKGPAEITALPPSMWVHVPTLANLVYVFTAPVPFIRWLGNSTIVSTSSTFGTLAICSSAGYSFARMRFRGRDAIFWSLIATMLVPGFSTLIPSYVWTQMLGLHDTYWVLILPSFASPFAVFLTRQFIVTLPSELFDAGRVDGCSEFGLWWRIAIPLSQPVLAALGTFVFVGSWNDFLWPLVVISKLTMFTVQVGVVTMQGFVQGAGPDYGTIMATALVLSIPPIVAFLFMQRYLVSGLTIGAIKG